MSNWWIKGKQFNSSDNGIFPAANLKEPYIYDVYYFYQNVWGEYLTHLKEAWTPLMYTIVNEGLIFYWVDILSYIMIKHRRGFDIINLALLIVCLHASLISSMHIIFPQVWDGTRAYHYPWCKYIAKICGNINT